MGTGLVVPVLPLTSHVGDAAALNAFLTGGALVALGALGARQAPRALARQASWPWLAGFAAAAWIVGFALLADATPAYRATSAVLAFVACGANAYAMWITDPSTQKEPAATT